VSLTCASSGTNASRVIAVPGRPVPPVKATPLADVRARRTPNASPDPVAPSVTSANFSKARRLPADHLLLLPPVVVVSHIPTNQMPYQAPPLLLLPPEVVVRQIPMDHQIPYRAPPLLMLLPPVVVVLAVVVISHSFWLLG
jgi:hypothetical protein